MMLIAIVVSCPDENSILGFVEGRLEPGERAAVESHVGGCATCERLLAAALAAGSRTRERESHSSEAPPIAADALEAGTSVGRYIVLSLLGRGGMGDVYAAYDPRLDRKIALKLLRAHAQAADVRREARLVREAQAIARLSHPNVVAVYDVGAFGLRTFVAMEYVQGQTLAGWLASKARSQSEILAVFTEAARGLSAAHAARLIHRDFKPENVMVGDDGHVRVADFGLARRLGANDVAADALVSNDADVRGASEPLTRTGELLGTPLYMAPEQFQGKPTDARTDQFSFCVALYLALYGEHPFSTARNVRQLMADVLAGRVRAAPAHSTVAPGLRRTLLRGLAADPDSRWPSMAELTTRLGRDPARTRRRWLATAGATLVLAGLVLVGARMTAGTSTLCRGGRSRLVSVWPAPDSADPRGRRTRISAAFQATGLATASETWQRIRPALDRYATAWLQMYGDACEATHVRGEQSSEVLDLRMACLEERRAALEALTEVMAVPDPNTVTSAINAVAALPTLDRCANPTLLRMAVMPLGDQRTRARAEEIKRRAVETKALFDTGHQLEASRRADALLTDARALDHAPITVEMLLLKSHIQINTDLSAKLGSDLEEALRIAVRIKRDDLAAEAAAQLSGFLGYILRKGEEGNRWSYLAEALLDRMGGGDPVLRSWVVHNRGLAHLDDDPARALRLIEEALRLKIKSLGLDHPDIGISMLSKADALARTGDLEGALEASRRARDLFNRAYGPSSIHSLMALANEGEYLVGLGHLEEGVTVLRECVSQSERQRGPNFKMLAYPLAALGRALVDLGRPEEGKAVLLRALRLRGDDDPDQAATAETRFFLARALSDTGERARAIALARATYTDLVKFRASKQRAAQVAAWLDDKAGGHR